MSSTTVSAKFPKVASRVLKGLEPGGPLRREKKALSGTEQWHQVTRSKVKSCVELGWVRAGFALPAFSPKPSALLPGPLPTFRTAKLSRES